MRLAVLGPQNTGKSTFIADFIKNFPNYITPSETYRDIIQKNNLHINQKGSEEAQRVIRDFLFKQITENKEQNILFDRCVIDNYVYSLSLYDEGKASLEFLNETFNMSIKHLECLDGLIFIPTTVAVPLVDDNLRDIDVKFIDKINRLFIKTLFLISRQKPIEIFVMTGSREERIKLSEEIFNYMESRLRL
ncbi:MAG: hypothetical protein QG665_517 [Patescibacteria group bacterium]|nr:hypothetical protein [Patescibacteria group bacterium]